MAPKLRHVKEELKNITTVNLIANTSCVLEKILWALIAICGTLFIYDVVVIQLDNWNENPSLVTKQLVKLSDMPVPSLTFCHKGLQKYGPVERLANMIDPEKTIPKEVFEIRNEYLKQEFQKIKDNLEKKDFCSWLLGLKKDVRKDYLILMEIPSEDLFKLKCEVSILTDIHNRIENETKYI